MPLRGGGGHGAAYIFDTLDTCHKDAVSFSEQESAVLIWPLLILSTPTVSIRSASGDTIESKLPARNPNARPCSAKFR